MTRRVSLNARKRFDAFTTESVEVILITIESPLLDDALRVATDGVRLSDDPLTYGTRSNWRGADPLTQPFETVLVDAELPSDLEDTPAATTLILSNVPRSLTKLVRSFTPLATVHMALVFSDTPDVIEQQWLNLKLGSAEGTAGEITLSISRQVIEDEIVPMDRMSKHRFPGLFR